MTSVFDLFNGIYRATIVLSSFVITGKGVIKDCYNTTPWEYDGHQNTTHDGTPCVRWDSVGRSYTNDQFPDATVSDAANFCRSVGFSSSVRCWTDRYTWEYCGITKCVVVIDCYSTTPEMYDGHQQTTKDGAPCLRWDSDMFRSNDDLFPDATVSDAANFCRAVDLNAIVCPIRDQLFSYGECGITKCDNDSLSKCGTLNVEKPAFLGRNVAFVFKPDSQNQNAILEWQWSRDIGSWVTLPLTDKFIQYFEDGTYYMIVSDSTLSDEAKYRIHYYNESSHCLMETTKLVLYDSLSKCGTLKIEEPAFLGRKVTFVFTPDTQDPYAILKWQWSRNKGPWSTIPLTNKFRQSFEDGIHYLTTIVSDSTHRDEVNFRIHYYNESMHCLMETTKLVINEINFDIFGSTLNLTTGTKTQVKCFVQNVQALNITWYEESDEGRMIKKQCYTTPECVLDVNVDTISQSQFVCALRFFRFNASKMLTVNIRPSEVPKKISNEEESDETTKGTIIGVVIGVCSAFVVTAVTIGIIRRKIRGKVQATSKRKKERNIGTNDDIVDVNLEIVTFEALDNLTLTGTSEDTC